MKIAVYTLARDRAEYTATALASLEALAGCSYAHYVVDNGSTDETPNLLRAWLVGSCPTNGPRPFRSVLTQKNNLGISLGSNIALNRIFEDFPDVDMIVKMDNDCRVKSENLLRQMAECIESLKSNHLGPKMVLSPRVSGINRQPARGRDTQVAGRRVGLTAIVGGLFHCVPANVYRQYRYPLDLPLAAKQDDHFCKWVKSKGGEVGYVEGLEVEHIDGTDLQAIKYPEYFKRKWIEETTIPTF